MTEWTGQSCQRRAEGAEQAVEPLHGKGRVVGAMAGGPGGAEGIRWTNSGCGS